MSKLKLVLITAIFAPFFSAASDVDKKEDRLNEKNLGPACVYEYEAYNGWTESYDCEKLIGVALKCKERPYIVKFRSVEPCNRDNKK